MKSAALLLSLQLAAAFPQTNSGKAVVATPQGCKVIAGDDKWPAKEAWQTSLKGSVARAASKAKTNNAHPDYRFEAQTAEHVQAAVKFAADHNLRLSILNSGHDFLGRNDAPTGLWLIVGELSGTRLSRSFKATKEGVPRISNKDKAEKLTFAPGEQAYVTFGAGVSTQKLNNALAPSGLFTMGAAHPEVSVAGGWAQAAGHSPLGIRYGLGADVVVEYKVVTADGQLKVANEASNPDLFWALRGGSGGSFGVVVEATVKAFPSPKMSVATWFMNTTNYNDLKAIYPPSVELHKLLPELTDKGVSGYYYIFPNAIKATLMSADKEGSAEWLNKTLTPVFNKLASFKGISKDTMVTQYTEYASFKAFFDKAFGEEKIMPAKATGPKVKRHGPGEMADAELLPMGIRPMDSVLMTKEDLNNPNLADALEKAMPRRSHGQLRGNIASGLKVHQLGSDTAVHPIWRKSYTHLIATGGGKEDIDVAALRALSSVNAAYSNEAARNEPDWKNVFWGSNYEKLASIQSKYDPNGLFWTTPGINADKFNVVNGRVCKVEATNAAKFTRIAPAHDNTNFATDGDGSADGRTFPLLWNGTAVVKAPSKD